MEIEFYNYGTSAGRAELHSTPEDRHATALLRRLFGEYVPHEMQARLPTPALRDAARLARKDYLRWVALINLYSLTQLIQQQKLRDLLGWGQTI